VSDLTARIDDAFTRPTPEDAIRLVKEAVADELHVLDPGAAVATTHFFNHSIHPDFVMTWHERGERQERPLYLRFEVAQAPHTQDLLLHGSEGPMFVGLLDHRPAIRADDEGAPVEPVPRVADRPTVDAGRSLIAEASAIDVLENYTREQPRQSVATSALVRAGAGRIDAALGNSLGDALARGFTAATSGQDPADVFSAVETLEPLIEPRYAERLTSHLQLLWLGSGGDLDQLFGPDSLDVESLDDAQLREVLEHVLTGEERPSTMTLRRLGQTLDPDRLGRMLGTFEARHFDAFAEVNAPGWRASKASVAWREEAAWGWRVQYEMLTFDAGQATIRITDRGRKLPRSFEGEGVPRTDFTERMGNDSPVELDLTGRETELVLRRRADAEDDVKVRPEQIDALGPLAAYVLRARVESPRLTLGGEDAVRAEIDYQRETVQVEDAGVPVSTLRGFVGRYFGSSVQRPDEDEQTSEEVDDRPDER
jgi:hypothetical protein